MGKSTSFRVDRLRTLRKKKGWTQEQLAENMTSRTATVNNDQVSKWENGKHTPSDESVIRMAEVLSVTTDYLYGLSDEPTRSINLDDLTEEEREFLLTVREKNLLPSLRTVVGLDAEDSNDKVHSA